MTLLPYHSLTSTAETNSLHPLARCLTNCFVFVYLQVRIGFIIPSEDAEAIMARLANVRFTF